MAEFLSRDNFKAGLDSQGSTTVPAPLLDNEAATKKYVDDHTAASADEVSVSSTQPTDPAIEYWINPTAPGSGAPGIDYVPVTGGTVTGSLTVQGDTIATWVSASLGADMGGYPITGVGDPVAPDEAVTRYWAESRNPPIIVLGASDPVPPDTLVGTIVVRIS